MTRLILATRNRGKFREISHRFEKTFPQLELESLENLSIPDVIEDQDSFLGNATKKAQTIAKALNISTLADDSGIEVDALQGKPGIFSARFAGPQATDLENNQKLIQLLQKVPPEQRTARFRCVMVFCRPEGDVLHTEGTVEGRIVDDPRGSDGFGYDPHFLLPDRSLTMAQISLEEKNRISHRAKALDQMLKILKTFL